jgi:hypothetical protein
MTALNAIIGNSGRSRMPTLTGLRVIDRFLAKDASLPARCGPVERSRS